MAKKPVVYRTRQEPITKDNTGDPYAASDAAADVIYKIMRDLGDQRLTNRLRKARERGTIQQTSNGNRLLREAMDRVPEIALSMLKEAPLRSPIHSAVAIIAGKKVDTKKFSKAVHIGVEYVISNYPETRKQVPLAMKIGRAIENETQLEKFRKEDTAEFKASKQGARIRKLDSNKAKEAFILKRGKKLGSLKQLFTPKERALLGMLIIDACVEANLIIGSKLVMFNKTYHCIKPIPEVLDWIIEADESLKMRVPYWLPLKEKTPDYKGLYEGGYTSSLIKARANVKIKGPKHRAIIQAEDSPKFYDAMTKVSQTAYIVNNKVLDVFKALWQAGGGTAGLPTLYDAELPPSRPEGLEGQQLFEWKRAASIIIAINSKNMKDRKRVSDILMVCKLMGEDTFYFPHHGDARGRLYPVATTLSPQGDNLQRSLTMFADSREVKKHGEFWLRINAANHFGNDKLTFEDRIKWTLANEQLFIDIATDPLANSKLWINADGGKKCWTFLAAALDLGSYLIAKKNGKPYYSHLPVYLDCSASGFQHLSMLALDPEAARKVNVSPTLIPQDIYLETANALLERVKDSSDVRAGYWADFFKQYPKAARKISKKVVMTTPYSVSQHAARQYVEDETEDFLNMIHGTDAIHLHNTEDYKRSSFLSKNLMDVIRKTNKSAFLVMDHLKKLADLTADANIPFYWHTPIGFVCFQETPAVDITQVAYTVRGRVKICNVGTESNNVNRRDAKNAIVPNFIHSLDAAALQMTILKVWDNKVRGLAIIHDSIGSLAEDVDTTVRCFKESMVEIYSEDQLKLFHNELVKQIKKAKPDIEGIPELPERGTFDPKLALESTYLIS